MQLNDVKKTIQFAWWSDESAASLPMTFQHADLPVVKSQLMNDVQVMNQRSFTNAFLQVRGCDKEDVFRIIKDEWLTNFLLRIIVHLMGHDNAYTDGSPEVWPTGYALLPEDLSYTLVMNPPSLNLVHSQPSKWNQNVLQQVSSA